MRKIIFISILLIFFTGAYAQKRIIGPVINTDTVNNISAIEANSFLFIDSNNMASVNNITDQQFLPLSQFEKRKKIPAGLVSKTFYLRFTLENDSGRPKQYFLYPGKLYKELELYTIDEGIVKKITGPVLRTGFVTINVEGNRTTTYLLKAVFFKSQFNDLQATLIAPHHLSSFQGKMYNNMTQKKIIGIILSGMLLMMIIMTILNYFITRKIEFLHNSLYSLCMFLLIYCTTYLNHHPGWFKGFFISYLDMFLLLAGTIFYISFTRYFLETQHKYPRIDTFFRYEIIALFVLLAGYSILHFGFENYQLELLYENIIKVAVLIAGIVYIVLAFVQRSRLMNYLAIGVAIQLFCYIISLSLNLFKADPRFILTSPFFYFELGVICSVLFFLLGLFYKNRHELISNIKEQEALKIEAEKQQFENKLSIYKAQQEERNRISADMHDDLGAGMTSIRLYSELAKGKVGENVIPEIDKISSSADELLNKMNAIIWSMSSHNDSLGNMVGYIRSYATDYLESTGIEHNIIIPENLPAIEVSGTIRRNVFLVIKEALQNIIKHSGAKKVDIEMKKEEDGLSLTIHDDGKGIDFNNIRPYSNGLTNMKKRMSDVGIEFKIENKNGTLISLYRKTV